LTRPPKKVGVTGVCGSGIIEIIAEMYLAGIITEDGVINGDLAARSPRITGNGRTFSYLLRDGEQRLMVTQTDVRAIQLAKAALYAGVKLLMDKQGIDHVDRIGLAGAFGSFIDPKYALVLGLVPDCDLEKVKAVGNAAGTGARMALLNRSHRREIEADRDPYRKDRNRAGIKFQEHFVNAMALPNKVDAFPRLTEVVKLPGAFNGHRCRRRHRARRRTKARRAPQPRLEFRLYPNRRSVYGLSGVLHPPLTSVQGSGPVGCRSRGCGAIRQDCGHLP
jgi:uncharacterized 2Fe-2S/4Fe-4S cluster protein (DUF4445 family)